jgi:hypothetical protein
MTPEETTALVGKKMIITGNSPTPYTVKEIWEHNGMTLCSFIEVPIVCNFDILKTVEA